MCVLKLILGKIFFCISVWSVWRDMSLRPNARSLAEWWHGSSRPDGYPTGFKIASLSPAPHNSIFLTFFVVYCGFVRFSHKFSSYFILFCLFLLIFSIRGTLLCLIYSSLVLFIVKNIRSILGNLEINIAWNCLYFLLLRLGYILCHLVVLFWAIYCILCIFRKSILLLL